ncbi:MAG: hypothetical protein MJZ61_00180 [Bacteroidales bacterium]|nr:hypothetical protein [Bacteroidales bacterium]
MAALALLVLVVLSINKFHEASCDAIDISIKDSADTYFIDKNQVLQIIHADTVLGHKMDSINIYALQEALKQNPYVRTVAIYKTISGRLKIDIQQRRPVLMVLANEGQSFYIDNDGFIFSTCDNYHSKTIVVNGFVNERFDFSKGQIYKVDLEDPKLPNLTADLFRLAKLIDADDFWRDQVEQIYINKLGEYELVPMVGNHILALGPIDDYDKKMYVLKQFYFKALSKIGWDQYKLISVKYKDQIVCVLKDKKK